MRVSTKVTLTTSKGNLDSVLRKMQADVRAAGDVAAKVAEEIVIEDAEDFMRDLIENAHYDGDPYEIEVTHDTNSKGNIRLIMSGPGASAIEYGTSRPGYWFYTKQPGNVYQGDKHPPGGADARYTVVRGYQSLKTGKLYTRATIKRAWDAGKIKRTEEHDFTQGGKRGFRSKTTKETVTLYENLRDYISENYESGRFKTGHEVVKPNSAITQGNKPNHIRQKVAEYIAEKFPSRFYEKMKARK